MVRLSVSRQVLAVSAASFSFCAQAQFASPPPRVGVPAAAATVIGNWPATTVPSGGSYTASGYTTPVFQADGVIGANSRTILVTGGGGITATNLTAGGLGAITAMNGGVIDLGSGSIINVESYGAPAGIIGATGLYTRYVGANGVTSSITANNLTVNATSDEPYGVYAHTNSAIGLTGLTTINTYSDGFQGWGLVTNEAGVLSAERVVIRMNGRAGAFGEAQYAVSSWDGGTLTISGQSDIAVAAKEGTLLYANGANSRVEVAGMTGSVSMQGGSGTIAAAEAGGVVVANGAVSASVSGTGNTYGLAVSGGGAVRFLGASQLSVAGNADAYGLAAINGGDIVLANNSQLQVSGAGQVAGIFSAATAANTASTFAVTGGTLASSGDGVVVEGGSAQVNFSGVTLTNGSGVAIRVGPEAGGAAGTLDFVASGSQLTGQAVLTAGSASNLTLSNGSAWQITGDSVLTQLALNNSAARFSPPAAGVYKTLTVQSLTGNGGVIGLNTYLGDSNSPTDRVIIDGGTAGGQTQLQVVNSGGSGAYTAGNGIRVVEVQNGGTTATGAFSLAGRTVAGPYEYKLFRGDAAGAGDDWYLRSEQPSDPGTPLYRPEVGAYLANQWFANQMFVHSMHDRLGEPQFIESTDYGGDAARRGAIWLRMTGSWEGSKSSNRVFDVSSDMFQIQAGGDVAQWRLFSDADRLHVGGMMTYANSRTRASAEGNPARAHGKSDGYGLGLYGTWFQNNESKLGAYVDTWLQYGWFNNKVDGDDLGRSTYDSHGWAVSAEAGYAFALAANWVLEPQAQVIYVNVNSDDVTDQAGTRITGGDSSGAITRLGVRTHRTFDLGNGRQLQPFATLNWWHTGTDRAMRFDGVSVGDLYPRDRYELKLGLHANFTKGWTGWVNVGGSWGSQDYHQYAARAGVKYTW